jgi:hypothetical protein
MKSVRLDPALEAQLEASAQSTGESISEFIRKAVEERCQRVKQPTLLDRLGDIVGSVSNGTMDSENTGDAFRRILHDKRTNGGSGC